MYGINMGAYKACTASQHGRSKHEAPTGVKALTLLTRLLMTPVVSFLYSSSEASIA